MAKVIFSVVSVCYSFCPRGGGACRRTVPDPTSVQGSSPSPADMLKFGPHYTEPQSHSSPSLDMFKLVQLGLHCTTLPPSPTWSNLFIMKHWLSECGWLAFDWNALFYRSQRSWGKVIFSQVSVILSTEGVPGQVHPPPDQVHPPEQCMPGDTGNKRVVRILLECILVV